jgi:3-vinyl bacteriochlorophyllide hydratase
VPSKAASDQENEGLGAVVPASSSHPSVSHHRDPNVSNILYIDGVKTSAALPHGSVASGGDVSATQQGLKMLYTPDERVRRDATKWTLVQGILAPVQFLVFLISLVLVLRYLWSGDGYAVATASVVIKTVVLYTIMITGAIWEKEVFGCYLFAPAFFWEDVFSFLVLTLHTAYLVMLFAGLGDPRQQMLVALAAYATYVVNAAQFVLKLRAARRDERIAAQGAAHVSGSRA